MNCLSVFDHFMRLALKGLKLFELIEAPRCRLPSSDIFIFVSFMLNMHFDETFNC